MPLKKGGSPCIASDSLRTRFPSATVLLQLLLQFFPFLSNDALTALPSVENICLWSDQPSSSPDPAVLVGAAGPTQHPQAAPGLGKVTSASTKATQLLFEAPMPSPHLVLYNVKLSWL